MKRICAVLVCMTAGLFLSGCTSAVNDPHHIRIWVAENTVDFTIAQAEAFRAAYPQHAEFTITVTPMGEGDAANNILTDVEAGADLYGFAQDQLGRLVSAGALVDVLPEHAALLRQQNDPGAVAAVTSGSTLYAYPMTADNGYFLYYDQSVVKNPSSLEDILADCERAGKNFYMEINSGWYQPAFFFGAGCTLTYTANDEGAITGMDCTYASKNGVAAMKAMILLAQSPAFVNGSSASQAANLGALVSGVWDASTVQSLLGDNYAAAKLPSVNGFQLGGFGGYKMLGVKPQTDERKLAACDDLALFLTSAPVQLARYQAVGWGPSSLEAQQHPAVQADQALAALGEQLQHCIPQGQYPAGYWSLATALGDDILAGKYHNATDEQLLQALLRFQTSAGSYVAP